jgi:hypothetical protein
MAGTGGKSVMLYPGEVGICSEQMYAWVPPQQVAGTLYLTNSRLVFEAAGFGSGYGLDSMLGLAPPSAAPMLNLDVRQISNAAAVPGPSGWHLLRIEAAGGAYIYNFQTPRAQDWVNSIMGARGGAPLASASPPTAPAPVFAPARAPSSPPVPTAAVRPPGSAATLGTVWCMRCGKANPPGGTTCVSCGSSLG